nr:immunoglobulin heavy chain junction region [Mus musculus]
CARDDYGSSYGAYW